MRTLIFLLVKLPAGSSWYLLCEQCRDKYAKNVKGNKTKTVIHRKPSSSRLSTLSMEEPHLVMKSNALFLLDLASSTDTVAAQRKSLPPVTENVTPPDCSGPFGPLPPFQCFETLGGSGFALDEHGFYSDVLHYHPSVPSTSGQRVSYCLSEMILSGFGLYFGIINCVRFHSLCLKCHCPKTKWILSRAG